MRSTISILILILTIFSEETQLPLSIVLVSLEAAAQKTQCQLGHSGSAKCTSCWGVGEGGEEKSGAEVLQ